MGERQKYFLGLDCGTSSAGWAVTDENYNLLRKRGKALWGMRLFDEAKTAADRRLARSNRRRKARAQSRIKLLQMLFSEEIAKVDPDFYIRLRESFFLEEDKRGFSESTKCSKNTLFNDENYQDRDYHKKYPTIWHLRKALIEAVNDNTKHFDIREYYLAIEHILKHRGHFLREGKIEGGAGDFGKIWAEFCETARDCGFELSSDSQLAEELLKQKTSKSDKKKRIAQEIFERGEEEFSGDEKELAGLLGGSKVSLKKLFATEIDEDEKLSFAEGSFEDNLPKIEDYLADTENGIDLVWAAKRVYDYVYLSDLLAGSKTLSEAMVRNYDKHKEDLKKIKDAIRSNKEIYDKFFKTKRVGSNKEICYSAYINKAYTEDSKGRKKTHSIGQDLVNKELKKIFAEIGFKGEVAKEAENGTLLPKQRGYAKGIIPQQIHHNELQIVLQKLETDFPSFANVTKGEPNDYNTKSKKIERIHDFRIPYYCGPMKTRSSKKEFTWASEEVKEIVRPWNYCELVNLGARADGFIRRMTNECTYLIGEEVLPKNSLAYQKYMVLNELNNLKINGRRIDNEIKQKIFSRGYLDGELTGNITLKKLKKWMSSCGVMQDGDELSGTNEVKILPKLSTAADFRRTLGDNYAKEYLQEKLEKVVELIVILGNEREMLKEKIVQELRCGKEEAEKLSRLKYKDWGRFSAKFLKGINAPVNGTPMSILDALWVTSNNLMELLGGEFKFKQAVDRANEKPGENTKNEISYEQVKELYCSPAVKRTVWQTIKIIQELKTVMGVAPQKIFLEVARGADKGESKVKISRRKDLIDKYKKIKDGEAVELLKNLDEKCEDQALRSKKLFLYYQQMGKCAYCGRHIDLEGLNNHEYCDIDHIYPRSKTKDDSVTRNLVLVHSGENREKANDYPVSEGIRTKMKGIWESWRRAELITKEKYDRLTRSTELTSDELAGFIARQIVETSQSVKAIRDLIEQNMRGTKVVLVKAGSVSDLRRFYGYNGDPLNKLAPMPEFIKVRELNDIHHAKDAYLNIVAGNVMNSTFTDNPYTWVKRKKDAGYSYSIRTERLFRKSENYKLSDNVVSNMPEVKGWSFADSIAIVSRNMKRNDVLWTRMNHMFSATNGGSAMDRQCVGKSKALLPAKSTDKRLQNTEKYGGYNGANGAYFALIQSVDGKRRIISIPIIAMNCAEDYVKNSYDNAKIILGRIDFMSKLKINGFPIHLSGKPAIDYYFILRFR